MNIDQMRLLVLTASNTASRPCRDVCFESMRQYRLKYPSVAIECHPLTDNPSPRSLITWEKISLILRTLPLWDYILWIDADAMIVGSQDFREIIQPFTLNISNDCNGINAGVMAWRNCPEAFTYLRRVMSMMIQYQHECHGAQAAMMAIENTVDVCYQPKRIWNAYAEEVNGVHDICDETMIVHYPGMGPSEPAPYMRKRLQAMAESVAPTLAEVD